MSSNSDVWSDWLLTNRQGDDAVYAAFIQSRVAEYADHGLDGANLAPGKTLLDVGTGEGLVAFRAIERVGPELRVVMTDVSRPMLDHASEAAKSRGVFDQCTIFESPADNLAVIDDASIDSVVTRAVLAYVIDKPKALAEFRRVLRPGGRLSICEPIFRDDARYVIAMRQQAEMVGDGPGGEFLRLMHRWKSAQFPDTDEACAEAPHCNYSERDLLNLVHAAGFANIHLQLDIQVLPSPISSWELFLSVSPHPWAPTLRTILDNKFTAPEREYFERILRPTVEAKTNVEAQRVVYVTADRP